MKARVAERAVEVLSEAFEIRRGETQDAAAVEMEAGEAGDEMDWRCDPRGGVGRTFSGGGRSDRGRHSPDSSSGHTIGSGHCPGGGGYNAHCGDHGWSNARKIGTAQPAGEPGAPAAFEGSPLSEARDVLDTGKGTDARCAGRAVELALGEAG